MPTELEREQGLLEHLRARNDLAALREADHLQTLYHDRQMDGLSQDVYRAAKGEGQPPQGWARLSEHPELLEKYAAQLHMDERTLLQTLHPDQSGFRAEIYVPDATMQQAGYKPTLAFKGSSGEVMTSDGKKPHNTTTEDFAANNFPQSIGLETDYYDRAMNLGLLLKGKDVDFEPTGHSLAGGMAAAVAAVTNTHATTFNAAGLNPITTERFAQQHPGVVVSKDLSHLITNYQVQGELLSDGVQNNLHNMDALRRQELGATLKETCDVLQRVPEARALFAQKLGEGLPPQAQKTVNAFVDKVATGNTDLMLRDLPLAAGAQHVLAAMTRDAQGNLMPRVQVTSLPETTRLATPLLESLAVVAAGARIGERGGEVVAAGGRLEAQGLHATGRGVDSATTTVGMGAHTITRAEGVVVQAGEYAVGATLAHARTAQAEMSAQLDQGLGRAKHLGAEFDAMLLRGAGHLLPEQAQRAAETQAARLEQVGLEAQRQGAAAAAADRHTGRVDAAAIRGITHKMETATGKATDAYGAAQQSVISESGHYARAGLDATAQGIEGATRHAPAAIATMGAVAGAGLALNAELNPANYPRLVEAATAVSHGKQAGSEALERHLMTATVTPSMDAHIASKERQALQTLQREAPARVVAESVVLNPARHQQRALHGESSQVDRAQEAQRQQETQGHTAVREASVRAAPTVAAPVIRTPGHEAPSPRHNLSPTARSAEAQTSAPARPDPATAVDPSHAALAALAAQQQAMHEPRQASEPLAATRHATTMPSAPVLSPPLDPPALRDFRHAGHPLNARYQMFRDALGEQGFHEARPTLNEAPAVRGYSAEQKDRLAAGFTAKLGSDLLYNTEIQHFRKDGEALLAIEHPRDLGDRPLVLAVPEAQTLAHTPEQHAAAWRTRELPPPEAVNTQRPDPHSLSPDHPGHPDHSHHPLFEHARAALTHEYARWGMQKGAESLDRETVQVMIGARDMQMNDVGAVRLLKNGPEGRIGEHPHLAVFATPEGPYQRFQDKAIVLGQTLQEAPSVAQSAVQFKEVDQAMTQQQLTNQALQAQIHAQGQQGPMLGGPGR
ncbi:hypothetical protein ACPPVV_03545 [Rhodanobacter sp. Col0626]|uniref:hypothetical protein n=1 Tax=Rhodanobacter sp. Col0626 TaxID=3415679 RepID=UPI003CF2AF94